ncbi:MAG TPA: 6,7-dimethyl-8-ribityllumazine synthase [Acidimicrobiales bacterium]
MTSSDATALPPSAITDTAAIVGSSYVGEPSGPARVAIVCAKFNGAITARLLDGALAGLGDHAVDMAGVDVAWVPGAVELPLAASRLLWTGDYDAVIALGAVIRGDTAHFDFVAGECAAGLQRVALDTGIPVVFGVLTTETVAQADERSGPGETNKGYEASVTALEMVRLLERLPQVAEEPYFDEPAPVEA